jgi:mannosyltransferase
MSVIPHYNRHLSFWHSTRKLNRSGLLLLSLIAIALSLRLLNLGGKSLWLDEAFSVVVAERPSLATLQNVDGFNPPLYFTFLHYWIQWFGRSEVAVRLPSVLASTINLLLLYALGRRVFNHPVALTAVALMAFSPLEVWYAQEARMYILMITAVLLAALGLSLNNWWGGPLIVLGLTAGLYLHYTMLPLWLLLSGIWLTYWWQHGRQPGSLIVWLAASAVSWWLYQPWLPHVYQLFERLNGVFFLARTREALNLPQFSASVLMWGLVLIGIGAAVGTPVGQLLLRQLSRRPVLVTIVLGLVGLFILLTPLPRLYSFKRLIVSGWPFFILMVAWLIQQLDSKRARLYHALLFVSVAATLITVVFVPKDDWRSVVAYLDEQVQPGELVWLDPSWNDYPYSYYQPKNPPIVERWRGTPPQEWQQTQALWLIAERSHGTTVPSSPSEAWLDENWQLVNAASFYRLEVRHYRTELD